MRVRVKTQRHRVPLGNSPITPPRKESSELTRPCRGQTHIGAHWHLPDASARSLLRNCTVARVRNRALRACVCNSDVPCTDSLARVFFLLGVRYCRENYAHQPEPVSASGTDFDFTAAICADRSDCESTYQSVRDRNRLSQAAQSTGTGVHDNCMTLTLDRFLLLLSMCRLACQFFSKAWFPVSLRMMSLPIQ